MTASQRVSVKLSPQAKRKRTASNLEFLVAFAFDGDWEAMYAAIEEYRANQAQTKGENQKDYYYKKGWGENQKDYKKGEKP
jgi:hypothetical protein